MEQRKYKRYLVEYTASFSREGFKVPGVILDLSVIGCRARTTLVIKKGDFLGVLIDVPRYQHPLYITLAVVRWSNGPECGMEFIQMELDDQRRLRELIRPIEAARA